MLESAKGGGGEVIARKAGKGSAGVPGREDDRRVHHRGLAGCARTWPPCGRPGDPGADRRERGGEPGRASGRSPEAAGTAQRVPVRPYQVARGETASACCSRISRTAAFLHLLLNMYAPLLLRGTVLDAARPGAFLLVYVAAGVGSDLVVCAPQGRSDLPMPGRQWQRVRHRDGRGPPRSRPPRSRSSSCRSRFPGQSSCWLRDRRRVPDQARQPGRDQPRGASGWRGGGRRRHRPAVARTASARCSLAGAVAVTAITQRAPPRAGWPLADGLRHRRVHDAAAPDVHALGQRGFAPQRRRHPSRPARARRAGSRW